MRATPAPAAGPLLEVEGTRLVGTDSQGQVRWELHAPSVVVDRRSWVTALNPSGYVVAEGGRRVQVRAGRAVYRRGSNSVRLAGGVRVEASPRRWLVAREVTYEAARDRLVATGGVQLQADGWAASAEQLQGEPALRRVRLLGGVRVTAEAGR